MIEVTTEEQLTDLIQNSAILFLFKHSTRCAISSMTLEEFKAFAEANPTVTCAFIDLIQHRDLSNKVAEISDIVHQSPQVIQFENGQPTWSTTHHEITQDNLQKQL